VRSPRQLLRTLVLAALLGAAMNAVLSAWCMWCIETPNRMALYPFAKLNTNGLNLTVISVEVPGKAIIEWSVPPPPPPGVTICGTPRAMMPAYDLNDAPEWSTLRTSSWHIEFAARSPMGHARTEIAVGWPWLSFHGGIFNADLPLRRDDFGPPLPDLAQTSSNSLGWPTTEPRTLPLTPLFPGLLANSAAFAGGWPPLVALPAALRRWRRRQRGACTACGYDRRGIGADAVCPECGGVGTSIQKRRTAPPARAGGSEPEAPA